MLAGSFVKSGHLQSMIQPGQNPQQRRSSQDQDKGVTWPTGEEKVCVIKGIILALVNKTVCSFTPGTSYGLG